ncbi:MAG: hypothetical protein ACOYB9_08555, partial [Luoshenia tenuis]
DKPHATCKGFACGLCYNKAIGCKKRIEPDTSYMVGITDMLDEQETREICTNVMGYPPKGFFKLGSAVSTNTGPDAVGIVFSGQKRAR